MEGIIKNPIFTDTYLIPFLSKAVEASGCYFFENQEWISKIYHLRIPKLLSNKILLTHFNLSEPIHKTQFNVRYPVERAKLKVGVASIQVLNADKKQKNNSFRPLIIVAPIPTYFPLSTTVFNQYTVIHISIPKKVSRLVHRV